LYQKLEQLHMQKKKAKVAPTFQNHGAKGGHRSTPQALLVHRML
jgi:hypothetical protein